MCQGVTEPGGRYERGRAGSIHLCGIKQGVVYIFCDWRWASIGRRACLPLLVVLLPLRLLLYYIYQFRLLPLLLILLLLLLLSCVFARSLATLCIYLIRSFLPGDLFFFSFPCPFIFLPWFDKYLLPTRYFSCRQSACVMNQRTLD